MTLQNIAIASGHGCRILLVDDESIVRNMATKALTRHGFDVVTAVNGAEAVDMLRMDATISLVLLDMMMPVTTGEQAIPLLRQVNPDIAILLSSGYSESEVAHQFATVGLQGFLQKPYSRTAILNAVNRARVGKSASLRGTIVTTADQA